MRKLLSSFVLGLSLLVAATAATAYTYSNSLKDARQQAIVTAIDAGGAAGKLEFGTAGMAQVLCTITLNYSPSGVVSAQVMTLAGFPKQSAPCAVAGTIAAARIRTSGNVDVVTGLTVTATGGGGNLTIDNTSVVIGQVVTVDHYRAAHP